jgi:hypothetical protein
MNRVRMRFRVRNRHSIRDVSRLVRNKWSSRSKVAGAGRLNRRCRVIATVMLEPLRDGADFTFYRAADSRQPIASPTPQVPQSDYRDEESRRHPFPQKNTLSTC